MAKRIDLRFTKTYATVDNAEKAVSRVLGSDHSERPSNNRLTYSIISVLVDGSIRYGVVFFGERAVQAGIHFHFTVAG